MADRFFGGILCRQKPPVAKTLPLAGRGSDEEVVGDGEEKGGEGEEEGEGCSAPGHAYR